MEYEQCPGSTKVNRACRVIYGTHLAFVMEGNIVRMCTKNVFKLLKYLAHYHYVVLGVEYIVPRRECPRPNYG